VRSTRILSRLARPQAVVFSGFLLVAGGIAANALFLQPGRHPAPLFSTRISLESADVPDALVQAVQAALMEAGYFAGPTDGIAGPQTTAAIIAFERRTGRTPTGMVRPDLLEAVRTATSGFRRQAPEADAPITTAAATLPDKRVAAVQNALARAAYGQIKADGVFGPQTREAILRFQEDHGLPQTGEISDALIVELRASGAMQE
jgi:peptidoglycan hydrolase-like protein with peptidoglycan-binding domain